MKKIQKSKHILMITILFIVSSINTHCSGLDVKILNKVALSNKKIRVAILPIQIKGARWGDEFADAIGHHLIKSPYFTQVERGPKLMRILKEQGFSQTGLIDKQTRIKIGKLTSASLIIIGKGTALPLKDKKGKHLKHLVDTMSLKAIDVETGSHLMSMRKRPGRSWTTIHRLKWILSLTFIWDLEDILIETSQYDELAEQIANKIEDNILSSRIKSHKKGSLK